MSELDKVEFEINQIAKTDDDATYKINIKIPMSLGWIDGVTFQAETTHSRYSHSLKFAKKDDKFAYFEGVVTLQTKALYHYYFSFQANEKYINFKQNDRDNTSQISKDNMWKMSVNFEVPRWAQGKMMYHIFVDRFYRGNKNKMKPMKNRKPHASWNEPMEIGPDKDGDWNVDFYGGDIRGIIEKLDYIQSMGISIIYLSPIVWSQSTHRYDASDYEKVDPYAGTNEDLKELCDKAHKRGIKVILDAVFNHTGNDSKYFNEFGNFPELGAYQSSKSKYFPFYRKYYSNNQVYFDYWWGFKNLPVCDGDSKEWQNFIYGEGGVIDHWFDLGIDGLRLDVADELSDEFIEGIHRAAKRKKKDSYILGEVWDNVMRDNNTRHNRSFLEGGKGMHSVMNYLLIDALIRYYKYEDVGKLKEILRQLKVEYPDEALFAAMNPTSTHDISRLINILGSKSFIYNGQYGWTVNEDRNWQKNFHLTPEEYQEGKNAMKSYLYGLTFLPGNISIFYGDEVGIQGMGDQACRAPYPWGREDKEILEYIKWIGRTRKKERFLEQALFEPIEINDRYYQFRRATEKEDALITINRSHERAGIMIPHYYQDADIMYPQGDSNKHELDAQGGIVLKKVKKR